MRTYGFTMPILYDIIFNVRKLKIMLIVTDVDQKYSPTTMTIVM